MGSPEKALDERVRTDVRISKRVLIILEEQGQTLGIPKNALFTMGACLMAARLVPLLAGSKKRSAMLDKIADLFDEVMSDARK